MSLWAAFAVAMGWRTSYRVYDYTPSFERVGAWGPHPLFKSVERRSTFVKLDCCPHSYWSYRRKLPTRVPLPPPVELPEGFLFDWLRDSAPLWEPGSTAFWLEPETCDQLAAWLAKYRPGEYGIFEAAGLRVEIVPPGKVAPHIVTPLQNNPGYLSALASMQQQYPQNQLNQYSNQRNYLMHIFGKGPFG